MAQAIGARKNAWREKARLQSTEADITLSKQRSSTKHTIDKSKRNHWKENTSMLSTNASDGKLWKILRGIDKQRPRFTPRSPIGGETWSPRKKATLFLKQCIQKGKINFTGTEERKEYRKKMDLALSTLETSTAKAFSYARLDQIIKSMDPKKACGPDHVEIEFLRQLSQLGKHRLLRLLNRSFETGATPAAWRHDEIISIEKPDKPGEF